MDIDAIKNIIAENMKKAFEQNGGGQSENHVLGDEAERVKKTPARMSVRALFFEKAKISLLARERRNS